MASPVGVRDRVLRVLAEAGRAGLTAEQVIAAADVNRNSGPPEITRLAQAGVVVPVGERLTSAGKRATAWALASVVGSDAQPIVMHSAGPAIATLGGSRLQACRTCGTSLPPDFSDGATVYEQSGVFTSDRPAGIMFRSCQRARRAVAR